MSGQKIIDGLREAIAYAKSAPVIGWDIGSPSGDFSALRCPNCYYVLRFRGELPKRCHHCRHRLTNLRIVK